MSDLRLEWLDPKTLTPNPSNWRRHPQAQKDALEAVIGEVGWAGALLFNERTNRLIDGHLRREMDRDGPVPVLVGSWTEEQEQLILVTLDPIAALAEAESDALAALLETVETESEAVRKLLEGLAEQEGIDLGGEPAADPGAQQVDKAAELQEKWGVALGDLWEIGAHRLACGDCTDAAVVERVMGGEKAGAVVTDPPFNVGFDYKTGFNDKKSLDDYGGWLWHALELWESQLAEPWCFFVWQAMLTCRCWPGWFPRDYRLFASVRGWAQYLPAPVQFSWDPVLFWSRGTSEVRPQAGRRDYFVSAPSHQQEHGGGGEHPCPRPLDACHYIVGELCEPGIVIDPFLGSGTTMVSCERLGRICRGAEIVPAYCAVVLERMSGMGLKPRRVG